MNASLNLYSRQKVLSKHIKNKIVRIEATREATFEDSGGNCRSAFEEGSIFIKITFKDGSTCISEIEENTDFSSRSFLFSKLNANGISKIDWSTTASAKTKTFPQSYRSAWQANTIFLRLQFDDGSFDIAEIANEN